MRRGDKLDSIELARTIIDAIAEKKGSDILLLDIRPVSLLADYFVICSGETERQIKAILDEVLERTKRAKVLPLHIEGEPPSGWVLMDYGSVIVHIFAPAERDYYRLEELWSDAPVVVKVL
ncbi:MAG TPA: ribosome silencing factor [Anaerolineae bacterium]|nr:ribosome silencing factor [Anaerolineae bacterium]